MYASHSGRLLDCKRHLAQLNLCSFTVKKNDLVLFMKGTPDQPMCGFSRAAVQLFDVHGVDSSKLKTFNVLEDEELRQGIKEYSSWPTIPQVYIKGEFIGGIDIMLNMHQSGDLEELLLKEGLIEPDPLSEPVEDGKA
ncbi:LOW QUALITY PROTEIN: monothiol glutaredoxin [Endogone sp. FLAS-F59071]|nr:LOW QUALITY PROTEIN: monothiol glutaredoxin [Endogone sp. FLAS-F59071]|eukprot:RUS18342.1 LOW QUALITY PROTEIN: monothiol glutaredoxin [Endogone sp. FLAS-F59071]